MSFINHFTRGGQLSLHKYQMIKQVSGVSLIICLLITVLSLFYLFVQNTSSYERYLYWQHMHAEFKTRMTFDHPSTATQEFQFFNGAVRELRSIDILQNKGIKNTVDHLNQKAIQMIPKAGLYGLGSLFLLILFFGWRGYVKSLKKLERGNEILPAQKLAKIIRKKNVASDLKLDDLPLIKDKETSHILVTGTTGSGKSNCLNTLIPQIRARGDRAIVVDMVGDFVHRYRQPHDLILNPLDPNSQQWSPWAECFYDHHYEQLASTIVPKANSHDPFWENAGKILLTAALRKMAEEPDIDRLYDILVQEDLGKFSAFFRGTDAASFTHADGEKMTISIRATLASQLKSFKLLKNTEDPFSVRQWVRDQSHNDWLFLTSLPDQRESLRPLITSWLDTAINALMSTPPHSGQKLWFIIDELPALHKLPSLETAMAEARKYGGCILAGIQSFPQLSKTYGQNQSQSILDLFNTKIFFRNTDPNTNSWISKVLGEAETTEHIENVSYGANTIRDGVSLSQQNRTKPLVLPTEIANLEDLESFVKLPGNWPVGKVKMKYKQLIKYIR